MSGLTILHGCCTLQLTYGLNTLIEESDFGIVGKFPWYARPNGLQKFSAVRSIRADEGQQRPLYLHRAVMNARRGLHVDHRNGDTLDNRRSNLRLATPSQNAQNQRVAIGLSQFKGVSRAGAYWRARIRVQGKLIQLGCHRTQEAAARAYDAAAREHFGEFACTNADLHGDY